MVAHFLPNSDPVQKVSIIARGSAGGYTLKVPTEDRYFQSKSDFIDEIAVLLAGHLVEKIFLARLPLEPPLIYVGRPR